MCLAAFCLLWMPLLLSPARAGDVPTIGAEGAGADQDGTAESRRAITGRKEISMSGSEQFSEDEGKYLISTARETIEQRLRNRQPGEQSDERAGEAVSPKFREKRGTFVTLTIDGCLRGCIGHIIPQESVLEGVRANAVNAAFRDPRFRPLTPEEWTKVRVEVSILTDPQPLEYSDGDDLLQKLRPDIDGVIIKKGYRQATFLPQVWEQLPDAREFLMHLCLKAGLDANAWQTEKLEVSTYQVQAFEEND